MVEIDPIAASPVGFADLVLGIPTYNWQAAVLFDLEGPGQVSLRCPNEAGKTTHVAVVAILWHMMVYPGSVTVATSGSFRQVKYQLMPALRRQSNNPAFRGWEFRETSIQAPNGSMFVAFSTDDPGRFEGFHDLPQIKIGEDEQGKAIMETPPLFVLVDEAKSVKQAIYSAIDRCRPTRTLLMSSPGGSTGDFYWSFNKNRALYRTHAVGLEDCPHLDREKIGNIIKKWGEDHPFVRSSVYGEFAPDPDAGNVIDSASLELCLAHPPQFQPGDRHAFVDFAAGGDENVLAFRDGNQVHLVKCWRERNTMAACGELIRQFRKLGLDADEISGDNSGLGKPIIDRLHELGWPIRRIENGAKASDPRAYKDLISELWGRGAKVIADREIILPNDDDLIGQLTTRLWDDRTSDGALKVQSKKKMKADGLPSPDRADAVLGSLMAPTPERVNLTENSKSIRPVTEWKEEQDEQELCAGFYAG